MSTSGECAPQHDPVNALVTVVLCFACIASFIPQHYRIISKGSSEGLSPWYLLLGSVGGAASLFNIITLQWSTVMCCPVLSLGSCLEATGGIIQIGIIWALFTGIQVLYIVYYPPHLKSVSSLPGSEAGAVEDETGSRDLIKAGKGLKESYEWRISVRLFRVLISLFTLMLLTTIYVVSRPTNSPSSSPALDLAHSWALFLGLLSTLTTLVQYIPQLAHTWRSKLVGALSMQMMCIQISGVPLIVWSIARRPGTNYTSYLSFLVTGSMQCTLLAMCMAWSIRQRRLGIDDFGNPLKFNSPGLELRDGGGDVSQIDINEDTRLLIPKAGVAQKR